MSADRYLLALRAEDVQFLFLSLVILTSWYLSVRFVLYRVYDASDPAQAKRVLRAKAWTLSVLNGIVMTVNGLYFLPHIMHFPLAGTSGSAAREAELQAEWLSLHLLDLWQARAVALFFAAQMILDLTIGMIDYPQEVYLLTGWIHHTVYLGLVWYLCWADVTAALSYYHLLELPTFLLSIGSVVPSLRTDLGMGISFFCTRILINSWALWQHAHWTAASRPGWIVILLSALALHIHWFSNWLRSYGPCARKDKKQTGGAKHVVTLEPLPDTPTPLPASPTARSTPASPDTSSASKGGARRRKAEAGNTTA